MTRHRSRHRVPVALAALCAALAAAGCSDGPSGPGVASVGHSASASATADGSRRESALAYSRCMRAHGIKDFPDPDANGGLAVHASPGGDMDPDNPDYQRADRTCKSLLPNHGKPPNSKKIKAANLKYAKCMCVHGVSDFPDPHADGTLQLKAEPGGDLDPNNPRYRAADKACQKYLKGLGGPGEKGLSGRGDS